MLITPRLAPGWAKAPPSANIAARPSRTDRNEARRRIADKPPTPLSARASFSPLITEATLSSVTAAKVARSGPWGGRCPRTLSHIVRSEERRVGKEGRCRGGPDEGKTE